MPFYLYNVAASSSGRSFAQGAEVKLAGNTGPLAALALRSPSNSDVPNKWHATGTEIVTQILASNPKLSPATDIVIDLKPRQKVVSLFRLLDVWGFSSNGWTPIALHLEALFDDENDDPGPFKKAFHVPSRKCESVGEFLYLQGAAAKDTWNWGKIGRVNGTLLWPDAFAYLAGELRKVLRCA